MKAVIFDLDDTLYPEREYAFSGFAAVAEAFEQRLGESAEVAAQMRRLFDTEHRPRVFNALLARRGVTEDQQLIEAMIETYRHHRPTISLYPDAAAALARLRGAGKLGLITDGPAVSQGAKIDALSIESFFDEIILTADLGPGLGKPHPRAFELMRERLAVDHKSCTYVADNPSKDFVAPGALGWRTVRITRADGIYRDAEPAEGGMPDATLSTLDDLETALG